jgi:hypothetical protein
MMRTCVQHNMFGQAIILIAILGTFVAIRSWSFQRVLT